MAHLEFCWGSPCYSPHSWQPLIPVTRIRTNTSLSSWVCFCRRQWGCATVCSLYSGTADHRWPGWCGVEHGRDYVDVLSIGFSILAVDVAATILGTEYVPSKLNVCDGLSRGVPPSELGLDESLWVHLPEIGSVVQYIRECDPRLPLITWAQVTDHMGLCHQLLTRI